MSLPSPTLTAPGLSVDQIQFQGLTIGNGTPFGLSKIEGIDLPETRSGNTERPRTRGAFVGVNLLKTRTITITFDVGPPYGQYGTLPAALAALRTATSTEGTTEYPLWIQMPGFPLLCCMARVLRKNVPWDITADLGGLIKGSTVQFEATDPYFYAAPTLKPQVGLPTPGAGFAFPLTFPLSFGGGTTANQLTALNSGNVNCWPVLVITGPCSSPSVSNASVAGNPTLTFDITLNAGDVLSIDCDLQTISFTPSGQATGSAYPQILQSGSTFFALVPGSNYVSFNSRDTSTASGTLQVWYSSAYDSLT